MLQGGAYQLLDVLGRAERSPLLGLRARELRAHLLELRDEGSEQRRALDEIRRSLPMPFVRVLAPHDALQAAFDACVVKCTAGGDDLRTMRPIRGVKSNGAPAAASKAGAPGAAPILARPPPGSSIQRAALK